MGIERKIFLYFITDTVSGKSFYVDNTGQVQLTNQPTFLPQAPEGWLDNKVTFGRSAHYYGINRTFTVPLKFVGDGARIIRNQFYTSKGVECPLTLIILKWSDETDIYELYYKGQIDLLNIEDNTVESVTANVIEGGVVKALKAFETTTYEIPCDGSIPENIKINISGILFDCNYTFNVSEQTQENFNASYFFVPSFPMIQMDGLSFDIETGSQFLEQAVQPGGSVADYYAQSNNWSVRTQKTITLTFTGQIIFKCTDEGFHPGRGALRLYFRTSLGHIYDIQDVAHGQLYLGVQTTRLVSKTITLSAGEKLFLGAVLVPSATERLEVQFMPESNINMFVQTKYKDSSIWAIKARDLFDQLVQNIGAGKYSSQSNLLDGLPNLAVTCGFAIRGDSPAKIKTSLSDFFDSFNAVLNASLSNIGDADTLFFEKKEYVFDSKPVTMDLGQVSNLKIKPYDQYFFNSLSIGYPSQTYDEKTGQYEYNTTYQWKAPFANIGDKKLTLVSKYRADCLGIEYVRSHPPVAKSTTNNDSDNAVFIINIDAANPVSDQYYNADKSIAQTGYTGDNDVNFDTTTGQPYMTSNVGNSTFTFNRTAATTVNYYASVTPQDAGGTNKKITLYNSSTIIDQVTIPANGSSQAILQGTGLVISPGDVIKVRIENTGGGSPYSINQANLNIVFTQIKSYSLKRVTYDSVSGIPNPSTYYNIEDLTPKRILMNHGNWIRSVCHNLMDLILNFQSCDKNPNLSTTKSGVTYTENAIVPISSLDAPILYPYVFEFDTKVPITFMELLGGAANGHIKFEFNGQTLYGYPIEVSQKPALNESQSWTLLFSPLNNLSLLQNLDQDGLNYLNLMGYQTFIPHLNPVQFVPLDLTVPAQYHFKTMDSDWFKNQIAFYTTRNNHFQPWQTNDAVHLQVQTNGLGPVTAKLLDCKGNILQTVGLTVMTTSAIQLPQILYQGNIALTGLEEGAYYILLTAGTGGTVTNFISEGMYVKADFDAAREPTLLLEYFNSRNKQSTIFTEGYNPSMRIYGWIDSYNPESKFAVYEDQPADIELLNGIPYRTFKLNIAVDDGVPDWVADKVNRIMLLDTVLIDGVAYTRNGDSKWEQVATPGQPKKYWSLAIREAKNRDGITLNTDGIFDDGLTVIYNVNTKGFGDGAGANNIVQVTIID